MRVIERAGQWCVQYGSWSPRGAARRFIVYREWPAADLCQAHVIAAREQINLVLDPVPVDAKPMEQKRVVARAIREAPADVPGLLARAREGLTDPLPATAESHARLGIAAPLEKAGGRQFYVYLAEPVYQRLAAMAVAADTTRNRIIEALLLEA